MESAVAIKKSDIKFIINSAMKGPATKAAGKNNNINEDILSNLEIVLMLFIKKHTSD